MPYSGFSSNLCVNLKWISQYVVLMKKTQKLYKFISLYFAQLSIFIKILKTYAYPLMFLPSHSFMGNFCIKMTPQFRQWHNSELFFALSQVCHIPADILTVK